VRFKSNVLEEVYQHSEFVGLWMFLCDGKAGIVSIEYYDQVCFESCRMRE
jgi:hypothetical protein